MQLFKQGCNDTRWQHTAADIKRSQGRRENLGGEKQKGMHVGRTLVVLTPRTCCMTQLEAAGGSRVPRMSVSETLRIQKGLRRDLVSGDKVRAPACAA